MALVVGRILHAWGMINGKGRPHWARMIGILLTWLAILVAALLLFWNVWQVYGKQCQPLKNGALGPRLCFCRLQRRATSRLGIPVPHAGWRRGPQPGQRAIEPQVASRMDDCDTPS